VTLVYALGVRPERGWLELVDERTRYAYVAVMLERYKMQLESPSEVVMEEALQASDKKLRLEAGRIRVLQGDTEAAAALAGLPKWGAEGLELLSAWARANYEATVELGNRAVAKMGSRKRKCLSDLEGTIHIVAALVSCGRDPAQTDFVGRLLSDASNARACRPGDMLILFDVYRALLGDTKPRSPHSSVGAQASWTRALLGLCHDLWFDVPESEHAGEARPVLAERFADLARAGGFLPVAREFEAVREQLAGGTPSRGLVGAFRPPAPWEAALARLENIAEAVVEESVGAAKRQPETELVWELAARRDYVEITPRLRGPRAKKGRPVALSRLLDGELDGHLQVGDHSVLATVQYDHHGWESRPFLGPAAALALVDHPRVIDHHGAPLAVERGSPRLLARRAKGLTRLALDPSGLLEHSFIAKTAPGRILVYERSPGLSRVVDLLRIGEGIAVPDEARDRLARAVTRLASVVGIKVEGEIDVGTDHVQADPRPVLLLGYDGESLLARVRVAPLGLSGPHLLAGVGSSELVAAVAGSDRLQQCRRELEDERRRRDALFEACPTLAGFSDGDGNACAPSLEDALEVVVELQECGDDVVLAWEEGRTLEVPARRDLPDLEMVVGSGTNWLGVGLRLEGDEQIVLGFQALLQARRQGRFVEIGRDRFVRLSERLRQRVDALADLGVIEGDELHADPVVLPLLDDLADGLGGVTLDDDVRRSLGTFRELAARSPRMPRGFSSTLRDYQRDGFVWMWRLAEAGLGACLADDMGLGKTVQTLALLSSRSKLGPALVVCPTSVVANWIAEAARFAPFLRFHPLADAQDRTSLLERLGARDVVVCSYTIATGEIDALSAIRFSTAVFDEAHALKNAETKRATAARRIDATFRLGLTGTPVENRATELWSLFAVFVPGLLGAKDHFSERFAAPIESGDRARARQLRALLRPFILRRTKAQVLTELPPRTDVTSRIVPRQDERAFYEAVRRGALARVESASRAKKRFTLLAEIGKLRQAAVVPRILDPDGPRSSKLDALLSRLAELGAEGHRALVFTQFLGVMAEVRRRLEAAEIEYFDLEGSTPAAERQRRIDAFQAGEGDVFVLSLRAGGVGVNLTGADYVFHLDPWWNPAVEDQATDRAHRIGQQRPVTVYRLVTEGTIEDKILSLHESKRQLADELLIGMEGAEPFDVDELVALLR